MLQQHSRVERSQHFTWRVFKEQRKIIVLTGKTRNNRTWLRWKISGSKSRLDNSLWPAPRGLCHRQGSSSWKTNWIDKKDGILILCPFSDFKVEAATCKRLFFSRYFVQLSYFKKEKSRPFQNETYREVRWQTPFVRCLLSAECHNHSLHHGKRLSL